MVKLLDANCLNGIVFVDNMPVSDVVILGEGKGASNGSLLIGQGISYYIPKVTPDITRLIDVLEKTNQELQVAYTAATGTPSPVVASNLIELALIKETQL